MMRRILRLLALALPLAAAACLGDDPVAPAPEIEDIAFASSLGVDLAASTKTASGLWYRDVTVGTGLAPRTGDVVYLSYTGNYPDGSRFDSGKFGYTLGSAGLIEGFAEGVQGILAGGRRQLIVPPHLGYGDRWHGQIPPNSVLVFDVKVDSVKAPGTNPE